MYGGFVFFELLAGDFYGIGYLFVVCDEYFFAYYFCYEKACGTVGEGVFAELGG